MPELATLGVGSAGTLAALCSAAAVGVLGLFGGGDGDADLRGIARRLDTDEDPSRIERRLDDLEDAIDAVVADADLERHVADPPASDADSVEKAEALERAVSDGRLSVRPATQTPGESADAAVVPSAAASLQRERSPSSPAARRLLDALASPDRADREEVADAVERAVEALDTRHALERALSEVETDGLGPGDARRIRDRLDHLDDEASAGVCRLAQAAGTPHETAESGSSEREALADATDTLTEAAADAAALDASPDGDRSVAERLRALADAVERDELGFAEGDAGRVPAVASDVRRSKAPESTVAKRLLDRLSSPGMGDLEAALDTAVEQLDAASTTRSVVADLDREAVADLADDVADRLDETEGPLAEVVAERVADLRGVVERADESNAVVPYAVRHELRFYDRTLLSHFGGGTAGSGGDASASIDALAERRDDVEDRYVEGRRDHNHSIPLHFLSLVDSLREEAERAAAAGDDDRAAGLCAAADETLDHVEDLYERNEYSVMLRRLRG